MAVGITSRQFLAQFIGNILIKNNGKVADKDLAKQVKEEFPQVNRDAATMAKLIVSTRNKLNRGALKYMEHTYVEHTFDKPVKPIPQFGAKAESPAPAPKAKAEKVVVAPKAAAKSEKKKPVAPVKEAKPKAKFALNKKA